MLGCLANHVVVLGAQRWTIVLELGGVVVVALLVLVMAWQAYCSLPVPFTFFFQDLTMNVREKLSIICNIGRSS